MSKPIIHVENLGKRYQIGERERYLALRDVLARAASAPARLFRARKPASSNGDATHIWALKDVSFDIQQGDVVGIIGRNGAGKTTLLKILARVTKPTKGFADVHGRMGSLLEVGTGFHPELTGRENTFLNGAILGMSKKEIERKFDEIVAFAEVEKFIDTAVKHYSSGMQVRLAFAVAAHLEPEILLVDEVLSVGDIQFQKKCMGKMGDVAKAGRTILFISHQMNQIRRLCDRVIWMDGGKVRDAGTTSVVVSAYEIDMTSGEWGGRKASDKRHGKARFRRWEIVEPQAEPSNLLTTLGPAGFRFTLEVNEPLRMGHHGIALFNVERQLMWAWSVNDLKLDPGVHELSYAFPVLPLRPGTYFWQVTLYDENGLIDSWDCTPEMIISTANYQHHMDQWNGVLNVPSEFSVHLGREIPGAAVGAV
jgi:ABC-type polysaccharide/polyol phosphate transport system ATPase subunit